MEYLEPLPTCDKILDLLQGRPSIDSYAIYHSLRSDTITGDMITNALSKLVDDKHLRTQGNFFNVGGDTLLFIQHGKYLGLVTENIREQKELSKEELKHLLDDATLKLTDSLIKTNKSVSDTNDFQKIFGIGSLIIGGVTMLFILVTTYRHIYWRKILPR